MAFFLKDTLGICALLIFTQSWCIHSCCTFVHPHDLALINLFKNLKFIMIRISKIYCKKIIVSIRGWLYWKFQFEVNFSIPPKWQFLATVTLLILHYGSYFHPNSRVWQLVYVAYICMPTFIGIQIILDMWTLTGMLIFTLWFKVFKIFLLLTLYKILLLFDLQFICLSLEETDYLLFTFVLKKSYFPIFHTNYIFTSQHLPI